MAKVLSACGVFVRKQWRKNKGPPMAVHLRRQGGGGGKGSKASVEVGANQGKTAIISGQKEERVAVVTKRLRRVGGTGLSQKRGKCRREPVGEKNKVRGKCGGEGRRKIEGLFHLVDTPGDCAVWTPLGVIVRI